MVALEIKRRDFFTGDGNYSSMFSIAFVKQGDAWNITLCHGGPMKKPLNTLESIFILRKTRQRIRPDLNSPNCMETSSNFLSLNVQ